jgi:hypothetical protein
MQVWAAGATLDSGVFRPRGPQACPMRFYCWKQWRGSEVETASHRLPVSQGPGHGNTPAVLELHVNARLPGPQRCLGSLKEQRRMIEEDRKKQIRVSDGKDSRWKIVDDWNECASREEE